MSKVIDYAWARPSMAALRAMGNASDPVVGVVRYLSLEPSKNLSGKEYTMLKAAGFSVALVWETNADIALGGHSQGVRDAIRANQQADALHYPHDAAIYYAVDFEASGAQMNVIHDYFTGVNSVHNGRSSGVYGSYYVIESCAKAQVTDYFWQTTAWSHGNVSNHADLLQHSYSANFDQNAVKASDWGQDTYVNKPAPGPPGTEPHFPLGQGQAFGTPSFVSGHNLHLWQQRMADRGWRIVVDDSYGPQTKSVAIAFQNDKHLHADGLIGVDTWNAAWKAPVT